MPPPRVRVILSDVVVPLLGAEPGWSRSIGVPDMIAWLCRVPEGGDRDEEAVVVSVSREGRIVEF